jgi:3-oxoacyl-[acyl-carrier-protein] synthase I
VRIALEVAGAGAVTAAGLTARQTCAAVRAALTGATLISEPFGAEQLAMRVPSHWSLRRSEAEWLAHLGARALRDSLEGAPEPAGAGRALYLLLPESGRGHPAAAEAAPEEMLARVAALAGLRANAASRVIDGGAAAAVGALAFAAKAIEAGEAEEVVLLAVDSLLNDADLARLRAANRLQGDANPQGLVPGEGAAALRLVRRGRTGAGAAALLAVAVTREPNHVEGPRFSQGRALLAAMQEAVGPGEAGLDWIVTTVNGERYAQWEAMIARARFLRTRREALPVVCPAMATGEIGAAAGTLALLVAADATRRGLAPGRVALCEAASEGGLRAAAVLGRGA